MKTISKILSIVLCLAMVMALFVVGASAANTTLTVSSLTGLNSDDAFVSATAGNYTFTAAGNGAQYTPVYKGDHVRIYTDNSLTITAASGSTIGQITFTTTGGKNLTSDGATVTNGGVVGDNVITFATPVTSCVITFVKQVRFKTIEITPVVDSCNHEGTGRVSVKDANKHWNTCQECGAIVGEKAAHSFTNGVCSCGVIENVAPVAGTTYKAGTFQANLGKTIYITGEIKNSRFLGTTETRADGVDVTVEAATGGFYLSFMDGTSKKYIDLKVTDSAQGYVNVVIADAPGVVYTFDATHKTFVAKLTTEKYGEDTYFIGANGTYNTLGSSYDGNLATYFPLYLYAIETTGGTGTEHTHNMVTKYDNTHHWTECSCGEKTDKVGHTLNNSKCACGYEKAAVVGYYKVTNGKLTDGKYVLVVSETKVAAGIMNDKKWVTASNPTISGNQVANPTDCVWTLDVDGDNVTITDPNGKSITNSGTNIIEGTDTWKWKYENGMFYFYKEAEEGKEPRYLSSNPKAGEGKENFFRAYYLTLEPDSYGNFYYAGFDLYKYSTSGNPSTGDNSVVSVAVAAAVLSVMGVAVLVSKKKEF